MKSKIVSLRLSFLSTVFFTALLTLMFSLTASAQAALFIPPSGNFVDQQEAKTIITDYISVQEDVLETADPDQPATRLLRDEVLYFSRVLRTLNNAEVPMSIVNGLRTIGSSSYPASEQQMWDWRNKAEELLTK